MLRWGIILDRQLLFATDDEGVARRFMAFGPAFQVLDHSTGYYAYIDQSKAEAFDLLKQEERTR
jgi:hypothetical protein